MRATKTTTKPGPEKMTIAQNNNRLEYQHRAFSIMESISVTIVDWYVDVASPGPSHWTVERRRKNKSQRQDRGKIQSHGQSNGRCTNSLEATSIARCYRIWFHFTPVVDSARQQFTHGSSISSTCRCGRWRLGRFCVNKSVITKQQRPKYALFYSSTYWKYWGSHSS